MGTISHPKRAGTFAHEGDRPFNFGINASLRPLPDIRRPPHRHRRIASLSERAMPLPCRLHFGLARRPAGNPKTQSTGRCGHVIHTGGEI